MKKSIVIHLCVSIIRNQRKRSRCTVPIKTSSYDVIEVHPFLSMEDMNLIQKAAFSKRKDQSADLSFARIRNVIYNEIEDTRLADRMVQGLRDILEDYRSKEDPGKKNAIGQLLTVGDIQIEDQVLTWEEAFRRSAGRCIQRNHL